MGVKVKTRKSRKIKRKYEITSTDKIPIIKEKLKQKKKKTNYNPARKTTKGPVYPKI